MAAICRGISLSAATMRHAIFPRLVAGCAARPAFWLLLALGGTSACLVAGAAPATGTVERIVGQPVPILELHGVGLLRFGDRFQWQLRTGLPTRIPPQNGGPPGGYIGGVILESVDQSTKGAVRWKLPEPPASGMLEIGPSCSVLRVGIYSVIRCMRDYLFNTRTGKQPIAIWPQFQDRIDPSPEWLAGMPLPWWRPGGWAITQGSDGSNAGNAPAFLFLSYGWVNYGNAVETTEIEQGPALLDLTTGHIARARAGVTADGAIYDASEVADDKPVAMAPLAVIRDDHVNGRRVITVLTDFDRCVAATCRSRDDPGFERQEPLTYVFD